MKFALRPRPRFIAVLTAISVLVLLHQNCATKIATDEASGGGQGNVTLASTTDTTGTGTGSNAGTATGAGTGTGTGGVTTGLTAEQKLSYCQSYLGNPILNSIATQDLTLKIGMGSAATGDANSIANAITANAGITNKTAFDAQTCASLYSLTVRCEVVEGDSARPVQFTRAYNVNGVDVAPSATTATQVNIAKQIFRPGNCQPTFNNANISSSGIVTANSTIVSAASEVQSFRCVEGSFHVRYTVRAAVGNINKTSGPMIARVTVQNGCWDPVKLNPSPALARTAKFGTAVAIDGTWAAVAAETDPVGSATRVGSVSVFEKSGGVWIFRQKIILPSASANDTVRSIALRGNKLFIGSPYKRGTGVVYHYERAGSDFVLVNEVSRPLSGDAMLDNQEQYFGYSLAFNGSKLVVGAPHYSDNLFSRMGRVYIYDVLNSSVAHVQSLFHNDASRANKGFGWSLALTSTHLAVGAPQAATKETLGKGDVTIYSLTGNQFSFLKKLNSTAVNNGAIFGWSVALSGTKLLIGAPWFDKNDVVNSVKSGAAFYVSDFNTGSVGNPTWVGNKDDSLGHSVALSASGALVGVPGGSSRKGYVNYYKFTSIATLSFQVSSVDTVLNDALGWAVATFGSDLIVGAPAKNDPLEVTGAAYAFTVK